MELETIYAVGGMVIGAVASRAYYKHKLSRFTEATKKTIIGFREYFFPDPLTRPTKESALYLRDSLKDLREIFGDNSPPGRSLITQRLEEKLTCKNEQTIKFMEVKNGKT